MKVLFAVNNEKVSESIMKKYQAKYKEIISAKNVYYFNAIIKELQKDKSYDRVVISEDLEPYSNKNYEMIDKFIFEKMDSIILWITFIKLVQPHYYKGERGNKPYPLELMLRIFILQNLYDLADMKVMNEVIDSRAFTAFCCINSPDEVPDGDTIGRFRNLLTEHDLQKQIFDEIVKILTERGLILKKGTIVDSTIYL